MHCKKRLVRFCVRLMFFLKAKHINLNFEGNYQIEKKLMVTGEIKFLLASINGSLRETLLFFVFPAYIQIILMRSLHNPIVT